MELKEGEQIDDLQYRGLRILQKKGAFRYGTDGVLLANYAAKGIRDRDALRKHKGHGAFQILDIGTGCGVVPILLCGKLQATPEAVQLCGIEIQPEVADLARRSVEINGQERQIRIDIGDVREADYPSAFFDAVTMNPPYVRRGAGILNDCSAVAAACHEIVCTQEELIARAAKLLRPGGLFFMVNKPDRLTDALCAMRENHVEPRELRMVEAREGLAPVLFLTVGVKNGGKFLRVLTPVVLEGGAEECFI